MSMKLFLIFLFLFLKSLSVYNIETEKFRDEVRNEKERKKERNKRTYSPALSPVIPPADEDQGLELESLPLYVCLTR